MLKKCKGYPGGKAHERMWNFMLAQMRGMATILIFIADTFMITIPFYTVAFFKWIIPVRSWKLFCTWVLHRIADVWIYFLNLPQKLFMRTRLVTHGVDSLHLNTSCLLMVNHQTWVDIMVLVKHFYRKIPDFKIFVKKDLLWLPIVGQAFWAVDFPIMNRYSRALLRKKPYLKDKDLEITKKACEKFKNMPVSVFNFVEGTRFRVEKHLKQKSPFAHLLRPKAGGTALVLGAMGEKIQNILNVTIVYPKGVRNFWEYLCGKVDEIRVHVELLPVTRDLMGDYDNDPDYRIHFQEWMNNLWLEKDRRIDEMLRWESVSIQIS